MQSKVVEFPFVLADVLKRLGMSQRKLAKLLDRPPQAVRRYYHDLVEPSWSMACRLAQALGVPVGTFLPGDPANLEFFKPKGGDQ